MNSAAGYAPDFTVSDINGISHSLYNYLDSGYVVVIELISVSCGNCIAHAAGTENSYLTNGPSGNNTARFIGLVLAQRFDPSSSNSLAMRSLYPMPQPYGNNLLAMRRVDAPDGNLAGIATTS